MLFLSTDTVTGWLDRLAQHKTLIAPRDVGGVLLYRPVSQQR